jgi:hypothetical protein
MKTSLRLSGAFAALSILACSPVLPVNVKLVTRACNDPEGTSALDAATRLRFTAFADGEKVSEQLLDKQDAGNVSIDALPAGRGSRHIVIEALDAGEQVVARGETGPMDFSQGIKTVKEITKTVFLRRTDAFTTAGEASCLLTPGRAGHTATTLEDGRVLIAGGFFQSTADVSSRMYLKTTVIYDPRDGTIVDGPMLQSARAFHTATHIPGSKYTLIAGGEQQNATPPIGELFDEETGTISLVENRMIQPRSRHAAAIPPDGAAVLLVGGNDNQGQPQATYEVFNLQTRRFEAGGTLPVARSSLAAVGLTEGRVLVVGGWNGSRAVASTALFTLRPGTATYEVDASWTAAFPSDQSARVSPGLAASPDGRQVLVTGGFDKPADVLAGTTAIGTSFLIDTNGSGTFAPADSLSPVRGGATALTLSDGSFGVFGGGSYGAGKATAHDTASIFTPPTNDSGAYTMYTATGTMKQGRHLGAFTKLKDGTVLATGGVAFDASGAPSMVTSFELFQPKFR